MSSAGNQLTLQNTKDSLILIYNVYIVSVLYMETRLCVCKYISVVHSGMSVEMIKWICVLYNRSSDVLGQKCCITLQNPYNILYVCMY